MIPEKRYLEAPDKCPGRSSLAISELHLIVGTCEARKVPEQAGDAIHTSLALTA